jgi:hypothetical protein
MQCMLPETGGLASSPRWSEGARIRDHISAPRYHSMATGGGATPTSACCPATAPLARKRCWSSPDAEEPSLGGVERRRPLAGRGGRSGGNRSGLGGSRGMGGIFHIISSNVEGLALGPSVGDAILGRVGPFGGFGCLLPFLSRASRPSISLRLPWMYGIGRTDSLRLLDSADGVVSTAVHAKAKGVGYGFRPCPPPVSSNGSIFRISVFWGPIPSVHDQSKGGEDHLPPPHHGSPHPSTRSSARQHANSATLVNRALACGAVGP